MIPVYNQSIINKYRLIDLTHVIDSFENQLHNEICSRKIIEQQDYTNILLQTAGNAIVTTREVICLCAAGFADGALGLARRLYEHFIILSFFAIHEIEPQFQEYIDDYYLDYERICNKYFKKQAERLAYDDLYGKTNDSSERIRRNAHHNTRGGNYWWSGCGSFENLAESVFDAVRNSRGDKIYIKMHALYSRACAALHPSSFSNTWRLSDGINYAGINTAPSEKGHEIPLELTALSMIQIIAIILEKLSIDYSSYISKLNELGALYVRLENENESLL